MALAATVLLLGVPRAHAQTFDPVYDVAGPGVGRAMLSLLPFEHIDSVTGNVFLTFTDLVLPGPAGFDLKFVRTYNSADGRWRFGLAGIPLQVQTFTSANPVRFETADGSDPRTVGTTGTATTQGFWRFTYSTRTLELPNGLVATYTAFTHVSNTVALLDEVRDPFDNVVEFNWDASNDLASVTQQLGGGASREVTFGGLYPFKPTSMSYDGRTWSYAWESDVASQPTALDTVTPPAGPAWSFDYEMVDITPSPGDARRLSSLTTPHGGTVSYEYTEREFTRLSVTRRPITITSRTTGGNAIDSGTWTFTWDDLLTTVTTPTGSLEFQAEEGGEDELPTSWRKVKNPGGTVVLEVAEDHTTLEVGVHDLLVLDSRMFTRNGLQYMTSYSYDAANFGQPHAIAELGETITTSRTTEISYRHDFSKYILGRVTEVETTVGSDTTTKSFEYHDTHGFLESVTEAGLTTTFEPDDQGNVESVTDPAGRTTSFTYEKGVLKNTSTPAYTVSRTINNDGSVATETRGSTTTTYAYDDIGRVTSVSTNTSGRSALTTTYHVNSGAWDGTTVTQGSKSVTTTLDGFGRVIGTTDAAGVSTATVYDKVGRVVEQSAPFASGVSQVDTTFAYDTLNRPTLTTRPDGSTIAYAYAAVSGPNRQRVTITETVNGSTSRSTMQYWQAFGNPDEGRLVQLTDPDNETWSYSYNGAGQLTQVSQPGAPNRTWAYTANGWLDTETHPESGTTSYHYNSSTGELTHSIDARGSTNGRVDFEYDANGRLSVIDPPVATDDVAMTYDAFDRPLTAKNSTGLITWSYDTAGRLTNRTDVLGGQSLSQSYAYDGNDNLTSITYPLSGRTVSYSYGNQGRITAVSTQVGSGSATTLASSVTYHPSGAIASFTRANGQNESITFDSNRHRPSHWVSGPLDITYAYDHVSNVTSIDDTRSGLDSSYAYDALDRLTEVFGPGANTFSYSPTGDRLDSGSAGYVYDSSTRRLSQIQSGPHAGYFTYDAIGSLLTDPSGAAYTYTAINKLKSVTLNNVATSYAYDAAGGRALKAATDGAHYTVRNAGGQPLSEFVGVPSAATLRREYVYLGGRVLASFAATAASLSVQIIDPLPHALVTSPIAVTAVPQFSSGTVSRIDFYRNGVLAGTDNSAPYSASLSSVPSGVHTLLARVVLTSGAAASSSPVTVAVGCSGSFTDSTLTAGTTVVKAVHINELRTGIDCARADHGLSFFSWSETVTAGSTVVKASHVSELRTALNQVYAAASLASPQYTDSTLSAGSTPIKAVHVQELRDFLGAID